MLVVTCHKTINLRLVKNMMKIIFWCLSLRTEPKKESYISIYEIYHYLMRTNIKDHG